MSKKEKKKKARAEPKTRNATYLCNMDAYDVLCGQGYTRLSENPEIMSAVNKIADLVSSMTIHLMENVENGDIRVKNELSKKIDIYPNRYMTRKTFIAWIVRTMLLEGDGNCIIIPRTQNGLLDELVPVRPGSYSLLPDGYGYKVLIQGAAYDPGEVIHTVINPDPDHPWRGCGYRVPLKEVAKTLKQATTTKAGFMESKWKPSIIVKVDGLAEELSSREGRKKLLEQYVETSDAGEPWLIPADLLDVKEVRPLSLTDIALPESVRLDKRTVASILDVPSFFVGEGEFKEAEWNNFISTRIKGICAVIEQEFTRKLLISPKWYFRMNMRSLYAYDIEKIKNVGCDTYTRGILSGNEVRDWLGYSPREGLDELIILENYIPQGMIGEQKKLIQGGDDGGKE